ncbi:MAG: FumA C-terminus/TtdB family hydratase beta subunit [Deltaproteobacteria bacterium]|nr:FumA C-terminus/TtdB family hydratase beta subunit [Deltaproteobacteria bacterium]
MRELQLPIRDEDQLKELKSGEQLELYGELIVARDQAHKLLLTLLEEGKELPFQPQGQAIYYMGPSPAAPGKVIGAAGPTTAGRMDSMTVPLLERGVRVLIGKGKRLQLVKDALIKHSAVYLAALGGAGALYSQKIVKAEVLAYPELGPEAILRIQVKEFPAVVINDLHGGDLYESGPLQFREK